MKRKLFLQFPLVAAALSIEAKKHLLQQPSKGFKIEAGKDRFDDTISFMGGKFDCKVSAKDTNGALCIYDTVRLEKGGPGLHYHLQQDEWFHVKKGEFKVQVGNETFHLKEGDSAFGPRMVPHAFAKINEGEAHLIVLFQPAGTMEEFFHEAGKINKSVSMNFEKEFKELSRKHGMEVVGPPLKIY
jgi:mannose-6-phosphate isomerase-like protein (cupin superfamily)